MIDFVDKSSEDLTFDEFCELWENYPLESSFAVEYDRYGSLVYASVYAIVDEDCSFGLLWLDHGFDWVDKLIDWGEYIEKAPEMKIASVAEQRKFLADKEAERWVSFAESETISYHRWDKETKLPESTKAYLQAKLFDAWMPIIDQVWKCPISKVISFEWDGKYERRVYRGEVVELSKEDNYFKLKTARGVARFQCDFRKLNSYDRDILLDSFGNVIDEPHLVLIDEVWDDEKGWVVDCDIVTLRSNDPFHQIQCLATMMDNQDGEAAKALSKEGLEWLWQLFEDHLSNCFSPRIFLQSDNSVKMEWDDDLPLVICLDVDLNSHKADGVAGRLGEPNGEKLVLDLDDSDDIQKLKSMICC